MRRWRQYLWISSALSFLMVAIALSPSLPSSSARTATVFGTRAVAVVGSKRGSKRGSIPGLARRIGRSTPDFRRYHRHPSRTTSTARDLLVASTSTHLSHTPHPPTTLGGIDQRTPRDGNRRTSTKHPTTAGAVTGTDGAIAMSPPSFMEKLKYDGSKKEKKAEPDQEEDEKTTEPKLPELSTDDLQAYDRMAVLMNRYHNHFRHTWNMLYQTCTSGSRPAGMSIRAFITQALQLCRGLTMHHTIEETYVFPDLAERMPQFRENDHLISQHESIHVGLVKMEQYLDACRMGERELRLPELKEVMDSFGEVLWQHLDDEVEQLGAENMRKFWTKEEMLSMNW